MNDPENPRPFDTPTLWITILACLILLGLGVWSWVQKNNGEAEQGSAMAASGRVLAPEGPQVERAAQRIVSVNMCADQYVLALVEPERIAGLTQYSAEDSMSAAAPQARALGRFLRNAEEMLEIKPDLVVGMAVYGDPLVAALPEHSYRTLDLSMEHNFADIVRHLRVVGDATGERVKADALIASMESDLAQVPVNDEGHVAAYYQRRGFIAGTGTLVDDLMTRTGLENLAHKLNKPVISKLTLEEIIEAKPDFLILEEGTDQSKDQGTEMLNHPALRDIPRIIVPEAWTVCGGPAYVKAAQTIAAQLKAASEKRPVCKNPLSTHHKTA